MLGLLPIALVLTGGYYFVRLRGFFLFHPRKTVSALAEHCKEEGGGAFVRMSLALAGTLGVGNVTGVAVGILVGGAGSVFWLLLSALFAAPLKYAESVAALSLRGEEEHDCGMLPVIEKSLPRSGKALASLYAILSVCLAASMGSALQSASVFESVREVLGLRCAGLLIVSFLVLLIVCIFGPPEKISKATAILIPIAMIMYTVICILTIISNISNLSAVLVKVMKDAFSFSAISGGAVGSLMRSPLREGFLRGLLSNEAGAGTSAYAHAKGRHSHCVAEGVFGMLEVVFDTLILCMLTAFAILLSVSDPATLGNGMSLLCAAFSSSLGNAYAPFLLGSVFLFALSTSLCWYEYGRLALRYLGLRRTSVYFVAYLLFCVLGAFFGTGRFVPLCDTVLFFLCLISLFVLIKNSAAVCAETERFLRGEENESLGRTRRRLK